MFGLVGNALLAAIFWIMSVYFADLARRKAQEVYDLYTTRAPDKGS